MKPRVTRFNKYWIAASGAAIALLGTAYIFYLGFQESYYCKAGSLPYYILVRSKTIRNFPQLSVVGDVLFHSGCGDGPKYPDNGVSYASSESTPTLLMHYTNYLESCGYTRANDGFCDNIADFMFAHPGGYRRLVFLA